MYKLQLIILTLLTFILSVPSLASVIIDDGASALCIEPRGIDHYFPNDGNEGAPSEIIGLTDNQSPIRFKANFSVSPDDISIYANGDNQSTVLDELVYRLLPYPDDVADDIDLNGRTYSEVYGLVRPNENQDFNESTIPFAMHFTEYGVNGNNAHGLYSFPGGANDNLFSWQTSDNRIDYHNYINEEVLPAQQNDNGFSADNTTTYIPMFIVCMEVYNSDTKTLRTKSFPIYSNTGDDGINLENHFAKESFYGYTADMSQLFSGEWGTDTDEYGRIDVTRRFAPLALNINKPQSGTDQNDQKLLEKLKYEPLDGVNCQDPESWLPGRYKKVGAYSVPDVDQCADGSCSVFGRISGFLGGLLGGSIFGSLAGLVGDEYTLYIFTDTYLDAMAKYYNRTQDQAFWEFANIEGLTDIPGDPSFKIANEDKVDEEDKYLLDEWYDANPLNICLTVDLFGPNHTECRVLAGRTPNVRPLARYCQLLANNQVEGVLNKDDIPGYTENECDTVLNDLYTLNSNYDFNGQEGLRIDDDDFDISINVAPKDLFGNNIVSNVDVDKIENGELPTVLRWVLNVKAKYPTTGLTLSNEINIFNNTFNIITEEVGERVAQRDYDVPILKLSLNDSDLTEDLIGDITISESGYEINSSRTDIILNGQLVDFKSLKFESIEMAKDDVFTMVFETAAYNDKPFINSMVQYKVTVAGISVQNGFPNISGCSIDKDYLLSEGGWQDNGLIEVIEEASQNSAHPRSKLQVKMPAAILAGIQTYEGYIAHNPAYNKSFIYQLSSPEIQQMIDVGLANCQTTGSFAGAKGPFQFMPGTWEGWKNAVLVSGRKQPPSFPNICNLIDSAYAAAAKAFNDGALQVACTAYQPLPAPATSCEVTGNTTNDSRYVPGSWTRDAIKKVGCHYYGAPGDKYCTNAISIIDGTPYSSGDRDGNGINDGQECYSHRLWEFVQKYTIE